MPDVERDPERDERTNNIWWRHDAAVKRREKAIQEEASEEVVAVLEADVVKLRAELDVSKYPSDEFKGLLKQISQEEVKNAKIRVQLTQDWANVAKVTADATDTAMATEARVAASDKRLVDLRAAIPAKAAAAGAKPSATQLHETVAALLAQVEVQRVASAAGGEDDGTVAQVEALTTAMEQIRTASAALDEANKRRAAKQQQPEQTDHDGDAAMGAAPSVAPLAAVAELPQAPAADPGVPPATPATVQPEVVPPVPAQPAPEPSQEPAPVADEQAALRAELVQQAQLMAVALADDTEAVASARSALRGRIHAVHLHGPGWLQGGIDEVMQARAQAVTVPHDEEASGDDDPPTPTPPGKRGRRRDANGRDAGDDTGMASNTEQAAPPHQV